MVTGPGSHLSGDISAISETVGRGDDVFPGATKISPMKNDPTFKVLALAVIAGVIAAFASPTRPAHTGAYDHLVAETESSSGGVSE